MSEPIVFISHFRVKEGKLDGLKQHSQKMIELIQAEKPGTVVFLQYFNEEATELSIIHVFPDVDAYNRHGEGVAERARAAFEFLERKGIEIYGMPGDQNVAMLRPPDGSGVAFKYMPQSNGGYIRLKPGE
jgi:quinol monooxygenase YgiN